MSNCKYFFIFFLFIASCSKTTDEQPGNSIKGGQDPFGPYFPVADWPKDISTIPGYEGWTWGAIQGIYAESADRIFVIQRGILPKIDLLGIRYS